MKYTIPTARYNLSHTWIVVDKCGVTPALGSEFLRLVTAFYMHYKLKVFIAEVYTLKITLTILIN